jgi:hypothetical protein
MNCFTTMRRSYRPSRMRVFVFLLEGTTRPSPQPSHHHALFPLSSENCLPNLGQHISHVCSSNPGTVTQLSHWLRARRLGFGSQHAHRRIQTGSGAHPTSYSVCTGGSFPGAKADWALTSLKCHGQEWGEFYLNSPIRLHGVVLKDRDNFTFTMH